jgi:energy-coupling factor transport system ATP-binding protein
VIRLSRVRYRYPGSSPGWILDDLSFSVRDGEYILLLGSSGSGKSTLGYALNGLVPHFFEGTLEGEVTIGGRDTRENKTSELFDCVGLVLQNADAQLFNSTVESEIAYGLESLGLTPDQIEERIRWVGDTLQIESLFGRSPMELSGGEKRIVGIASILCLQPRVLLLDEPYAHLDWEGTRRVREILREINGGGRTVIVIEQRLGPFIRDASRCMILNRGELVFDGPPEEAGPVLIRERFIPQYPPRNRSRLLEDDRIVSTHDLNFRLNGKEILKGVSMELRKGETVAVVGRNGAGKTTLIKHLNGLCKTTDGMVMFRGENIHGRSPAQMASSVGISFQNANDQFFVNKVIDELRVGLRTLGLNCGEWFEEVCSLLDLHPLLERSPYQLSEGQKKRVALASILVMRPELLVLDEPTAGQDGRFLEALAGLLSSLEERGVTTLLVTHDLDFASAVADRWIVLHEGEVVAEGSPSGILTDERLVRMGAIGCREEEAAVGSFDFEGRRS